MSSPRIIATRRMQVFMAHACSNCGFPVITVVKIEAESQKTYTFSQTKAEEIANSTAINAIEHEIKRIEDCRHTKAVLISEEKKSSMISPGYFCSSSINGFEAACPYCANVEPWQIAFPSDFGLSKKKMSELSDYNFPIVFKKADKAEQWAKEYVQKLMTDVELTRKSQVNIDNAKIQFIESVKSIKQLQQQLQSISELKDRDNVTEQLQNYKFQKELLGILDFKRRKEINLNIKALELKLQDINQVVRSKENLLRANIRQEENALLRNQAIALGLTGRIICERSRMSFTYFYEPNGIPDGLIISTKMSDNNANALEESEVNSNMDSVGTAETDTIVFCRRCGFKLKPGSAFCNKCGMKIDE